MGQSGGRSVEPRIAVLLADDDPGFLDSLAPVIESQPGLAVVGRASDGLDAIELADELEPDAVVIDVHMPLVDGVTAVARLRRDHPHLCVIALTGDAAPRLHEAVREAGADAVLLKDDFLSGLLERLAAARTTRAPAQCPSGDAAPVLEKQACLA